jgi:hypothetical protein
LVDSRFQNKLQGKCEYGKDVLINTKNIEKPEKMIGKFCKVRVESANAWGLSGSVK